MEKWNSEAVRVELAPLKFDEVDLCLFADDEKNEKNGDVGTSDLRLIVKQRAALSLTPDNEHVYLSDLNGGSNNQWFPLARYQFCFIKRCLCVLNPLDEKDVQVCLRFQSSKSAEEFEKAVKLCQLMRRSSKQTTKEKASAFDTRTEENSADLYFQFYGYLNQQQNMLQDFVRTSTYQRAILSNSVDFKDKVVMDVGAGTGILSFFAVHSGAKQVYAVEASSMAIHCQELVRSNNLSDRITVISGKVEEIELPEKVDVIVSEPMGYLLVNERMLESYVHARKFLNPNGRMFPTTSKLYFSLFSDEPVYQEQIQKSTFWFNEHFYGVNLSALKSQAFTEVFKQPVIDTWPTSILCSEVTFWSYNFEKDSEEKLHEISIPFELKITRSCLMHGLAFWFDVSFIGSQATFVLSTAPSEPLTHWYQVRCFISEPMIVHPNDVCTGYVNLTANERLSYDIDLRVNVNGVEKTNRLDLKNPCFRYMNGVPAQTTYDAAYNPSFNQTHVDQNAPPSSNGVLSAAMSFENIVDQVHVAVD
ncbi:hypothetical protein M3Y98_00555200 [Aphelenchoides besseyi]|nr:hypothetical protein M3Y98_00555200 [Aphelenchoides besseyi]KAI6194138.1 hypothetical protein M3Y96_01092900 [Aphelenchoides besseyi]